MKLGFSKRNPRKKRFYIQKAIEFFSTENIIEIGLGLFTLYIFTKK